MNGIVDIDRAVRDAAAEYPALAHLLSGYFHQDWREEHGGVGAALTAYRAEASSESIHAAIADIDRLLDAGLDETGLARVLADGFDCNHVPSSEGRAPAAWLSEVRAALLRPA